MAKFIYEETNVVGLGHCVVVRTSDPNDVQSLYTPDCVGWNMALIKARQQERIRQITAANA
jgi:hypothetical protein